MSRPVVVTCTEGSNSREPGACHRLDFPTRGDACDHVLRVAHAAQDRPEDFDPEGTVLDLLAGDPITIDGAEWRLLP